LSNDLGGIMGSCYELCAYLTPYGQYAVDACDIICIGLGLDEFMNMLINDDIDPIWYSFFCLLILITIITN
jgi:hypothetical protein